MKKVKQVIGTTLTASLATGIASTVAGTIASAATIDEIYKAAYEATISALASKDQDSINAARVAISKLPSQLQGFIGEFSKQLDSVQHPILVKIVDSINNADGTGKQVDINAARMTIPAGLPDVWKNSYSSAVDKVQQKLISKVVDAVNAAQTSQSKADIDAARVLINEIALVEHNDGVKSWIGNFEKDFLGNVKLSMDKIDVVSSDTIKVSFIKEVDPSSVTNKSFVAYGTSDNSELWNSTVTVAPDNKSVEIKFSEALKVDKDYTIEASGLKDLKGNAAEAIKSSFVYTKADIASIALTKDVIKSTESLSNFLLVKDSLDRDITLGTTVTFETSDTGVVDATGAAKGLGEAVVTPVIKDSNNTVIFRGTSVLVTVSDTAIPEVYQGYTVYKATDGLTSVYSKASVSNGVKLNVDAQPYKVGLFFKDKYGTEIPAYTNMTFVKNLTPDIAYLTPDVDGKTDGTITTKAVGTAYFKVIVQGIEKTISVNVTETAKPVDLSIDRTSASMSVSSTVSEKFKLSVKDQYGDKFDADKVKVEVKNDAGDFVAIDDASRPTSSIATAKEVNMDGNEEATVEIKAGTTTGTATYRVTYEYTDKNDVKTTLQKTFTVDTKAKGTFKDYAVTGEFSGVQALESDKTIVLDKFENDTTPLIKENEGKFEVYKVDNNGSKYEKVAITYDDNIEIKDKNGDDAKAMFEFTAGNLGDGDSSNDANTIKLKDAAKEGTYTVNVKIANYIAKTYTLTIKDSQTMAKSVTFTSYTAKESIKAVDGKYYQDLKGITSLVDQFGDSITLENADTVYALSESSTRTNISADGKSYDLVVTDVITTVGGKASTVTLAKPVVLKITNATAIVLTPTIGTEIAEAGKLDGANLDITTITTKIVDQYNVERAYTKVVTVVGAKTQEVGYYNITVSQVKATIDGKETTINVTPFTLKVTQ